MKSTTTSASFTTTSRWPCRWRGVDRMPWKEATKVDEKRTLVILAGSGLYQKRELAEMFGVSRPTVDPWIDRYGERRGRIDEQALDS